MELPPVGEATDAFFRCVLPAGAVAAAVFSAVACLRPKRLAPLAAALALAAAFAQGNYLRESVGHRLEPDRPLTARDLGGAAWQALARPATPAEGVSARAWYWLPWLAALALATDLMSSLPRAAAAGWAGRPVVALLAARLLLPDSWSPGWPWPEALLAAVILALWLVPRLLARRQPGGSVPLALAVAFGGAAVVLLQAHTLRLTDLSLIGAAALAGVALAAWQTNEEASGVAGAAAVFLPALLLLAREETFSEVPAVSYAAAALAPLAMTPLLLVPTAGKPPWRWLAPAGVALAAVPALLAAVLAVMAHGAEG